MATQGFIGFYVETRNYGATASFWRSLGFANEFETDHGSGQWRHLDGGPYVFIAEVADEQVPLVVCPILGVENAAAFSASRTPDFLRPFEPQHWNVVEALIRDPDGRQVSLQAPLPSGTSAPDADEHHAQKYG